MEKEIVKCIDLKFVKIGITIYTYVRGTGSYGMDFFKALTYKGVNISYGRKYMEIRLVSKCDEKW